MIERAYVIYYVDNFQNHRIIIHLSHNSIKLPKLRNLELEYIEHENHLKALLKTSTALKRISIVSQWRTMNVEDIINDLIKEPIKKHFKKLMKELI